MSKRQTHDPPPFSSDGGGGDRLLVHHVHICTLPYHAHHRGKFLGGPCSARADTRHKHTHKQPANQVPQGHRKA